MYPGPRRTQMNRFLIRFTAACAYLILLVLSGHTAEETIGLGMPTIADPADELVFREGFGDPDQFAAYHVGIRSEDGQFSYPANYRIEESRKAVEARKQPGRRLNWIERGPANVPGRTRAIVVDPSDPTNRTWFAGSVSGGLWKTEDGGKFWIPLTDHLPNLAVSALAIGKSDPEILYMGTGEGFYNGDAVAGSGIFRSADGGRTWAQLASTATDMNFRYVNRLAIDPADANTVLAATNLGLFRTEDGGDTWSRVFGRQAEPIKRVPVQDLRARPDNFDIQFATLRSPRAFSSGDPPSVGVAKSTDAGRTWHMVLEADHPFDFGRMELAFAPSNPDVVYVSADNKTGSHLYRSSDGGETWLAAIDQSGTLGADWLSRLGWYAQSIAVHPFDENRVFLGSVVLWESVVDPAPVAHRFVSDVIEQDLHDITFGNMPGQVPGESRWVWTGHNHPEVAGVTTDDYVTVELRFGPGRSQKAHRYSVAPEDISSVPTKTPLARYRFEDYVDVPFEVWDTDNSRQLMASFRDTADNGEYDLVVPAHPLWPDQEYIFVHLYDYDGAAPRPELSADGGVVHSMLYFVRLYQYLDVPTSALDNLPNSLLRIVVSEQLRLDHKVSPHAANPALHVDHHNITLLRTSAIGNAFGFVNANDGGVFFSADGGSTFSGIANGYNTTQFYGVDKKPGEEVFVAGAQDNGSWYSPSNPDARQEWTMATGGDGFDAVWHSRDPDLMLTSIQNNGLYRSTTAGASFASATRGLEDRDKAAPFVTSVGNSKDAPDRVFVVGRQGVWRSEDFAGSWELVPLPAHLWRGDYVPKSGKVRVSLANPDVVWAGYRLHLEFTGDIFGTVFVSRDGGLTFSPAVPPDYAPRAGISGIATHPLEASTAYVLFSVAAKPKILRTADWGQTWTDLSGFAESSVSVNGFPDVAVYDLLVMPHDTDILWAATEIGIFESTDAGATWQYGDSGLPAVSVWQMRVVDDLVVVATHGRGIWTIDMQGAIASQGFGPTVGNDFVLLSAGVSTRIGELDGRFVADPVEGESADQVLQLDFEGLDYRAFFFDGNAGLNLAPNLRQEDALHMRLLVDPRNGDGNGLALVFEDKTDWSRAADGSADLPFRAAWSIPGEYRDGNWHELSIPLPPATWHQLEDARAAGGPRSNWHYAGATSPAGFRVAGDNLGPGTSERPELWQEFEWTNVRSLGIARNVSDEGGPVWIKDVYIGQPGLDLDGFGGKVAPVTRVSARRGFDGTTISWHEVPAAGGYNVYVSERPISDIAGSDVFLLQRVRQAAVSRAFTHAFEVPHASAAPAKLHYAVTSLSPYGVENPDVSASAAAVSVSFPVVSPAVVELTDGESGELAASLASGIAASDGFPQWQRPFRVDGQHSSVGEQGSVVKSDADLSGTLWLGQSSDNRLYMYAEIRDDILRLAPEGVRPSEAWQYDSIELGWGNYDVRSVQGGSALVGTPHRGMERGARADYLLRISAHGDGSSAFVWVGGGLNAQVPGGAAVFDMLQDGAGNDVGWKILAAVPLDAIQNPETKDAVLEPVTGTELRFVPMNIGLNDADETGVRDSQIQWSTRQGADGHWWHTPAQWPVVAVAGRHTWTGGSEDAADVPERHALLPNYPNPFNPATTIAFNVAGEEPVTLAVFDALGRRVATLVDAEHMSIGRHTVRFEARQLASGVYFYQLRVGRAFAESRRMLLVR